MEEIEKIKCIKTLNFTFISEKTPCLLCQSHGESPCLYVRALRQYIFDRML